LTRLLNIDNGGTLTDICVIDGDDVAYTKTLTTPFDLSRCLFDGLTKASAVVYGEERLAPLLQTTDLGRSAPEHAAGRWGLVLEANPTREGELAPKTGGGATLAVVPEAADPEPMMRWVRALT
jgi:N-methylhydantoinase A